MTKLRFISVENENVEIYQGKSDDYGNPYTEELIMFNFEDNEGNLVELAFGENDLYSIVEKLKIII